MNLRRLGLSIGIVVPLIIAALGPSASGQRSTMANRFPPSGVVTERGGPGAPVPSDTLRALATDGAPPVRPTKAGTSGCPNRSATNVRVNQECTSQTNLSIGTGRGQAQNEPSVAVNPRDGTNIVASQNDYRRGDGGCGVDFSVDGGRHWGSGLIPVSFTPGFTAARHYWDASGDTSVAFDSGGTAYLLCMAFNRGVASDLGGDASGLLLFRSLDGGASWTFPGDAVALSDGTGADGIGLLDKPYMSVDDYPRSPRRDRIYVAWAQFSPTFTASPIHFAWSGDSGATWHQTGAISGESPALCPINISAAAAGTCDANQFPQPFVAPNGDVYVVYQNFNNCAGAVPGCDGPAGDNHNQMLVVKSTDGGVSFDPPVKVTDFYDLPDCAAYTGFNAGRACVPTAPSGGRSIFRATNYPVGIAASNSRILVTFGSYLNAHSNPARGNCRPSGFDPATFLNRYVGVGVVDGCNNDILLSESTDGGRTFTGTTTPVERLPSLNDEGSTLADQWWQWADRTPAGKLSVAYYDRKYGRDQATGFLDLTLRNSAGSHVRVTDRSLPPGSDFPAGGGSPFSTFLGDYTALAVGPDSTAVAVWTDTRHPAFGFVTAGGVDPRELVPAGFSADIYSRRLPG
jgi:hypothetical protein